MDCHVYTAAVIAAGGSSTRCGSDKLEFELGGETVLMRTVETFEHSDAIDEIVIVARADRVSMLRHDFTAHGFKKVSAIVAGGKTRTESVKNGVAAVSPQIKMLCIHDAARPFVTNDIICRTIAAACEVGAATAAMPVKNTIKIADANGLVLTTPPRETLWEIQTPQCFSRILYQTASESAQDATDDCQLFERMGYPVRLVMGDYRNIKLTTPEDLSVARTIWEDLQCE